MSGLAVGINDYDGYPPLDGCVEDAEAICRVLSRDGNDKAAFQFETLFGAGNAGINASKVRSDLSFAIAAADGHNFVFYFSGHGAIDRHYGLELMCQEGTSLAFSEVMTALNNGSFAQ